MTFAEFELAVKGFKAREEREHYRIAILCSVIANVNRGKNTKAYKPEDFMPKEKKEQDWQDMLAQVEILNVQLKGVDGRCQEK